MFSQLYFGTITRVLVRIIKRLDKLNDKLIKKISKSTITIQRIPREKTTNLRDLIQSIPIKYLEPAKRNFHPQSFSNINDFSKPSPILESNAEINYNDIDDYDYEDRMKMEGFSDDFVKIGDVLKL